MSSVDSPQPESPAPEQLVAYLDGELSPDECRQVEERLANDADYRQQLHELDQAWEALDSLPSTSVDDDFARTTIEMVAIAAREEQKQRTVDAAATSRNRRRLWAIAGAVAVLASFVAARLLLPDANARLLGDLPVITQMDWLDQIQDVDFLRQLSKEVPLGELAADEAAVERSVEKLKPASDKSFDVRRQYVESLSPEQKANLAAQAKQFDDLPKIERDRLKNLEAEIAASRDCAQLQRTLAAYGQFLTRRTSGELSRLRGLASGASDDGIRRIRETIRQELQEASRRLSESDAMKLREEITKIYNEYKDDEDFLKALPRRDRDDRPRRPPGSPEDMPLFVASWALRNKDTNDKTQQRLYQELSPQAQKHLDELARRDGERRVKFQLWQWMRDALKPAREPGEIERFFATDLDNNQRERLLSLPKDDMGAELERMYLGDQFGLRGAEWLGTFGEPGRGPGPGGPGWRPNGPPPDDRRGHRPRPDRPPFPPPDGPPPPEPGQHEPI
jgi:hypothetical protein